MLKHLAIAMAFCGTAVRFADGQSLTLFDLPGGSSPMVSDDGTIVVIGDYGIWTPGAGLQTFQSFAGLNQDYHASLVSRDGKTFVGNSTGGGPAPIFRWSQHNGFQDLGFLPNPPNDDQPIGSAARAVSADGSVVAGIQRSGDATNDGFRWTVQTNMVSIGAFVFPSAVSDDGSVIVGSMRSSLNANSDAFRWTQETGAQPLPRIAGFPPVTAAFAWGVASDVSANGNVVVGVMGDGFREPAWDQLHLFRWTEASGTVDLGLSGDVEPSVSADGNIVVGAAPRDFGSLGGIWDRATIWDQAHGQRWLNDVAIGRGIDIQGFQMDYATDISGDGRFIVGLGAFSIGIANLHTVFLLDLGPVPEPATGVLALLSLLAICAAAPRRRESLPHGACDNGSEQSPRPAVGMEQCPRPTAGMEQCPRPTVAAL
jgi:uncharacterized membrane protein